MVYETGPNTGKTFKITKATLRRWWMPQDEVNASDKARPVEDILGLDFDTINEPYPEPTIQQRVKKPQSVIEYESTKRWAVPRNNDLPEYDKLPDVLIENGIRLKRINKGYISLIDDTKIKRFTRGIGVLASELVGEHLSKHGLVSRKCIERGTPFRYDIKTKEEFEQMICAFKEVTE
jgi:hypothetical protein